MRKRKETKKFENQTYTYTQTHKGQFIINDRIDILPPQISKAFFENLIQLSAVKKSGEMSFNTDTNTNTKISIYNNNNNDNTWKRKEYLQFMSECILHLNLLTCDINELVRYVYMYVCMHVYMYVCMYACMHAYVAVQNQGREMDTWGMPRAVPAHTYYPLVQRPHRGFGNRCIVVK